VNARAQAGSLAAGIELVHREARFLDEQRWDEWLALYLEDCEYWMPAWKADGTLTGNPKTELSHIYYASRAGLEDRVVRIRSGKSAASTPMPRTAHVVGSVLALESPDDRLRLSSTWVCHVYSPRSRESWTCTASEVGHCHPERSEGSLPRSKRRGYWGSGPASRRATRFSAGAARAAWASRASACGISSRRSSTT
jgi:3-phenylpropionate/cinnamic acid dioxygenase small subunit